MCEGRLLTSAQHHLLTQHVDWRARSISANASEHAFQILNITIPANGTQSSMTKHAFDHQNHGNVTINHENGKAALVGMLLNQRRLSQQDSELQGARENHDSTTQHDGHAHSSLHVGDRGRTNSIASADTSDNQRGLNEDHTRTVLPSIDKLFPLMAHSPSNSSHNDSRQPHGGDVEKDKKKKRNMRLRRKWSEQEKDALMKGIEKHGPGNWTIILNDEEFSFDNRTATDLKDKYRTCYPARLATEDPGTQQLDALALKDNSSAESHDEQNSGANDGNSVLSRRFSFPIPEVYRSLKRPRRRERRPFDDRDDKEILEGLRRYGPAWSQIQRDASFHLLCRRPLDLRDRVRNRFPDLYKRLKKNLSQQRNQKQQARDEATREFVDLG
ncbi:telomere-associated protein 1 [Paramyrothecium foliicola]|nr:telomere-associated protein 1 [Paramyrothecium foliicola]